MPDEISGEPTTVADSRKKNALHRKLLVIVRSTVVECDKREIVVRRTPKIGVSDRTDVSRSVGVILAPIVLLAVE